MHAIVVAEKAAGTIELVAFTGRLATAPDPVQYSTGTSASKNNLDSTAQPAAATARSKMKATKADPNLREQRRIFYLTTHTSKFHRVINSDATSIS